MTLTIHDPKALQALGRALQAADYQFTAITPATHRRVNARAGNAWADGLRDVFGWSRPFRDGTLSAPIVNLMRRAGVLQERVEGWRSNVRAATLGGHLYFHSAFPTTDNDAVFFGPDTYRFAAAIERMLGTLAAPPQRVADVCCGAAPGALTVAQRFPQAQVLALDINHSALALAAVNARLAGAAGVTPLPSDLLRGVEGDFDLILANPPYLLDADERTYRHGGGRLGDGISLKIVEAALERLRPGGSLGLYTGVAIVGGADHFRAVIAPLLDGAGASWRYEELDPDVFGGQLGEPGYEQVERIAAVWLHAVKRGSAQEHTRSH